MVLGSAWIRVSESSGHCLRQELEEVRVGKGRLGGRLFRWVSRDRSRICNYNYGVRRSEGSSELIRLKDSR